MNNIGHKGFTLIELMVVIAIIGILVSIVIANLNNAKQSARDLSIKNAISEAMKKVEMYYDDHGTYDFICAESEFISGGLIYDSILENGGSFVCGDGPQGYCVSATLNKGGSVCADGYRELKEGFVCSGSTDILCD